MNIKVILSLLMMISLFASGLWGGWYFTAKDYRAEIAVIERNHAKEMAEQSYTETQLLADAFNERKKREADYIESLNLLSQQLNKQKQNARLTRNKLEQLEKESEEIRDLGAMPTPNNIVEWLR